MTDYLRLMTGGTDPETRSEGRTVEVLVDTERYPAAKEAWDAAIRHRRHCEASLEAIKDERAAVRMNARGPVGEARSALAEAQEAEGVARAAVRECFVRLHLAWISGADNAAVAAEGHKGLDVYPALLRRCLIRASNPATGEAIPELTPDVVADYVPRLLVGEQAKLRSAIDSSYEPVDFPT